MLDKKTEQNRNREQGFTLVELLVAGAVIATIASVIFLNAGTFRGVQKLNQAAQQLALDLRRAQNLSLAPSDSPICVYGVYMNSASEYFVYKNTTDEEIAPCTHQYDSAQEPDATVATTNLPGGITISSLASDVSFEAPEPVTYVDGALASTAVIFTLSSASGSKNIVVNRFGNVEIQ
ncbi:MAG: prepilin-type N-terminal cleavage/methylation domain-containing protein [Patescibacteria group bacterium]